MRISILLCLFFLVSCSKFSEEDLKEQLDSHAINRSETTIIFIPYQGCSNCLSKALQFLTLNAESSDYSYVFVNFRSKKEIQIRLKSVDLNQNQFYFIPKAEKLYKSGISNFYPSILRIGKNISIDIADIHNTDLWDDL